MNGMPENQKNIGTCEAPGLYGPQGVVSAEPLPGTCSNPINANMAQEVAMQYAMPAQKVVATPVYESGLKEREGIVGGIENAVDYTGQLGSAAATNVVAGTKAVVFGSGDLARDAAHATYVDRVTNPIGNVAGDAQKAVSHGVSNGYDYVVNDLPEDTGNFFSSISNGIADAAGAVKDGVVYVAEGVGNKAADAARFTHVNVVTDPIGNGAAYAQRSVTNGISDGAEAVAEFVGIKDSQDVNFKADEVQVAQFKQAHQQQQDVASKTYALDEHHDDFMARKIG